MEILNGNKFPDGTIKVISRSEAIKSGIEKSRAARGTWGRPKTTKEPEIRRMLILGHSQAHIRRELKCGTETVRRVYDRIKEGKKPKP